MVRHILIGPHANEWEVQCPSCRQMVLVTKAIVDGQQPLPLHSTWAPSYVQRLSARWSAPHRSRFLTRSLVRLEWLARFLTRNYEPACRDTTPRNYWHLFPTGYGPKV